jgi:hypothetical protein
MRLALLLLFWLISPLLYAASANVVQLRSLYYRANEDKQQAEVFYEKLKGVNEKSEPLLVCYKAMAFLMQAKHSYNPYQKLAKFRNGKNLLEQAIARDPANVEMRFMRFCVQTQVPAVLAYSDQLDADRTFIIKQWPSVPDADLKEKIRTFMLQYGQCSDSEKMCFR